jgi:hypothetical protein
MKLETQKPLSGMPSGAARNHANDGLPWLKPSEVRKP